MHRPRAEPAPPTPSLAARGDLLLCSPGGPFLCLLLVQAPTHRAGILKSLSSLPATCTLTGSIPLGLCHLHLLPLPSHLDQCLFRKPLSGQPAVQVWPFSGPSKTTLTVTCVQLHSPRGSSILTLSSCPRGHFVHLHFRLPPTPQLPRFIARGKGIHPGAPALRAPRKTPGDTMQLRTASR